MSSKIYVPLLLTGALLSAAPACSDDGTTTGTGGASSIGGSDAANAGGSFGAGGFVANAGGSILGNSGGGPATGGVIGTAGGAPGNAGGSTAAGGGPVVPACESSEAYFSAEVAGLAEPLAAVYDYGDPGGDAGKSCITLTNPLPGEACAEGTAMMVVDEDYASYWGAGVGYQLDPDGAAVDLSSASGFSFTITGAPTGLRVGVAVTGSEDSFFTSVVEGANTLLWTDLATGSWVEPAGVLDLTIVKDIQFQVPSGDADVVFDFCVSGLTVDGFIGQGGAGGI